VGVETDDALFPLGYASAKELDLVGVSIWLSNFDCGGEVLPSALIDIRDSRR
jgi:hypothetical protein